MLRVLLLLLVLWCPAAARAAPELCERALRLAASEAGLPEDLLRAIALAESGRSIDGVLRPWPWTANIAGQGHWMASEAALLALVEGALAAGQRNIDIGCFQVNWHWHGHAFARPRDLIDPLANARHAARYLLQLLGEFGTIDRAVGAYHSRDPERARRYAQRVAALRSGGGPAGATAVVATASGDAQRRRQRQTVRPGTAGPRHLPAGTGRAAPGSLVALPAGDHPFIAGLFR